MDLQIIKTIDWSDNKALILALAQRNLGTSKNKKADNFIDFLLSYPMVSNSKKCAFLEKIVMRNDVNDVTNIVTVSEDACLFSAECSVVKIIAHYIEILNTGGKVPALWCYLDCEKKAVIHFVNKSGWYAELHCLCNETFSSLHLLKINGKKHILPVNFIDGTLSAVEKYVESEDICLQNYRPRELYDLLSNKSGTKKKNKEQDSPQPHKIYYREKGDLL